MNFSTIDYKLGLKDWEKMDIAFYEKVLIETKERFNAYKDEELSVTDKAYKLIVLLIGLIYFISERGLNKYSLLFAIASLIIVFIIIMPRKSYEIGVEYPSIYTEGFNDSKLENDEKTKLLCLYLIERYNEYILYVKEKNKTRISLFTVSMILMLVSVTIIIVFQFL